MTLYQAEQLNVAYQSLYNKDLTSLKNEWRKHLQAQSSWAYNYQEWLNKKLTGLNE